MPSEAETELLDKIKRLERKVKRLEKRLREKKVYEKGLLIGTGATPGFIAKIDAKDDEVLSS